MTEILSLNSNLSSLRVQRGLNDSTARLSTTFERLSSGQRINRASDDAAGLAVADQLRVQARLSNTALRNISDGISALNIVDSSLQSQSNIITRLQELATQSANGTLSDRQRSTLNGEYQSLVREFGRIGNTTQFNNINLLLGGHRSNPGQFNIQAGISGSTTANLSFNLSDTGTLSGKVGYAPGLLAIDPPGTVYSSTDALCDAYIGRVNRTTFVDSNGVSHEAMLAFNTGAFLGTGSYNFSMFVRGSESNGADSSNPNEWVCVGQGGGSFDLNTGKVIGNGAVSMSISGLAGGATGTYGLDCSGLTFVAQSVSENISTLDLSGIETQKQALATLSVLSTRRNELATILGGVGAMQSRLKSAHAVVSTTKENTLAAESRIRDVDVAEESSVLIASNIRQQTAAQVLGLANSQPKMALSLLSNI